MAIEFLILTAVNAIVEVLVQVSFGAIIFLFQIVKPNFISQLSHFSFKVLTPCMLTMYVAQAISVDKLGSLWIPLVFEISICVIGFILAYIVFLRRFFSHSERMCMIMTCTYVLSIG